VFTIVDSVHNCLAFPALPESGGNLRRDVAVRPRWIVTFLLSLCSARPEKRSNPNLKRVDPVSGGWISAPWR
jgi:hypothetical protein